MKWKKTFIWKNISIICLLTYEEIKDNNENNENNESKKILCLYRPDNSFKKKYFEIIINEKDENIIQLLEPYFEDFIQSSSSSINNNNIDNNIDDNNSEGCLKNDNNNNIDNNNINLSSEFYEIYSEREIVLEFFQKEEYYQALLYLKNILSSNLQNPIIQYDYSSILYYLNEYQEAINGFKKVISLIRRKNRFSQNIQQQITISNNNNYNNINNNIHHKYILHNAYNGIGKSYEMLDKNDRAIASYILAIKIFRSSKSDELVSNWDYFNFGDSETSLNYLLLNSNHNNSNNINDMNDTNDIEDILNNHSLKSIDDPFSFSCTMCGECCRTSDRILLTPEDIYLLTRSSSLSFLGIHTTTALLSHSRFDGIFHYTRKDGYPVCYLRPILENSHCRFAYPLYTRENIDTNEKELIPFEEIDGVTNEGIKKLNWNPIINRSEKISLGCMLGKLNMPTLCASYPVAPELSQIDFWHTRRVFWRTINTYTINNNISKDLEINSQRIASGWQSEEHYVTVKSHNCEGFTNNNNNNNNFITVKSTQTIRSFLSNPTTTSTTLKSINESSKGVLERWEELQWFFSLIEDISLYFPVNQIYSKKIQLQFLNTLALIWYNFDSLLTARSRPFRSYRRLKKDIEILTWIVVKETKQFLENSILIQNNENEEELSQKYKELIKRLNIT